MSYPAARFAPPARDTLGLRIPAELARHSPPPVPGAEPVRDDREAARPLPGAGRDPDGRAVELDRVVPPSGNLRVAGQQIWLGPAMTGRTVRLWAGLDRVHVLLDGYRIKTLSSRLDSRDLARTVACPVPEQARSRLRGGRPGTAQPPRLPEPLTVIRRVSVRGAIMIGASGSRSACRTRARPPRSPWNPIPARSPSSRG